MIDTANRLLSDDDYSYVYDLNGNLIAKTPQPESLNPSWAYAYDALDQLITVSQGGAVVERYRYDALGRRTLIETANDNGGFDRLGLVNDGLDRALDVTPSAAGVGPALQTRYTHCAAIDEPLLMERFDSAGAYEDSYTYHADYIGSVRYLTDSAGRRPCRGLFQLKSIHRIDFS